MRNTFFTLAALAALMTGANATSLTSADLEQYEAFEFAEIAAQGTPAKADADKPIVTYQSMRKMHMKDMTSGANSKGCDGKPTIADRKKALLS